VDLQPASMSRRLEPIQKGFSQVRGSDGFDTRRKEGEGLVEVGKRGEGRAEGLEKGEANCENRLSRLSPLAETAPITERKKMMGRVPRKSVSKNNREIRLENNAHQGTRPKSCQSEQGGTSRREGYGEERLWKVLPRAAAPARRHAQIAPAQSEGLGLTVAALPCGRRFPTKGRGLGAITRRVEAWIAGRAGLL